MNELSIFGIFGLQSFGGQKQFPHIFFNSFLINNINFFHNPRTKNPIMIANIFLGNFGI